MNEQIELDHSGYRLDVVQAEFICAETTSWENLFGGYSKLYAITYSSGIDFICKLIKNFDKTEIIFGYEEILSYNLQEIMAYQLKTVERLRERASKNKLDLVSRIDKGSLRMFVARDKLSHEKIYL